VDLQMCMDWRRCGSTISDEAWGAVDENGASGVPKSKVSVPAEWWVETERTWEGYLRYYELEMINYQNLQKRNLYE
jgi:hypothetical protein